MRTIDNLTACVVMKSKRSGYAKKPETFTIGGFEFIIDGKRVPFDFMDYSTYISFDEEGHLIIESYLSGFDTELYENGYREVQIPLEQISAELFRSAQYISELYYECYEGVEVNPIELELVQFEFNDEPIPDEVIKHYNEMIEGCIPGRWLKSKHNQYVQRVDFGMYYVVEAVMIQPVGEESKEAFGISSQVVDVYDIPKEELEYILERNGYESIEVLREKHGKDADKVIAIFYAECSWELIEDVEFNSEDDAIAAIRKDLGLDLKSFPEEAPEEKRDNSKLISLLERISLFFQFACIGMLVASIVIYLLPGLNSTLVTILLCFAAGIISFLFTKTEKGIAKKIK